MRVYSAFRYIESTLSSLIQIPVVFNQHLKHLHETLHLATFRSRNVKKRPDYSLPKYIFGRFHSLLSFSVAKDRKEKIDEEFRYFNLKHPIYKRTFHVEFSSE